MNMMLGHGGERKISRERTLTFNPAHILRPGPTEGFRIRGVGVSLAAISVADVAGTAWFAVEPRAVHVVIDGEDHG